MKIEDEIRGVLTKELKEYAVNVEFVELIVSCMTTLFQKYALEMVEIDLKRTEKTIFDYITTDNPYHGVDNAEEMAQRIAEARPIKLKEVE